MSIARPSMRASSARAFCVLSAALAGLTLCMPRAADAQTVPKNAGFALNCYEPSESGSEWFANDTLDLRGSVRPSIRAIGD
jgi:hypothetical protein